MVSYSLAVVQIEPSKFGKYSKGLGAGGRIFLLTSESVNRTTEGCCSFFILGMILAIALVLYDQRTINSNRKIMATEQELQSLFNTLDSDGDGKVSINELFLSPGLSAVISAETGVSSPQELLSMYGDKDGSITFEELKSVVEKAGNLN
ncbi:signal transduction protein (plasmid) [Nostoc linckia NIES-25]|nr:signal transduction protein [Nostoc linckia NIES-25]